MNDEMRVDIALLIKNSRELHGRIEGVYKDKITKLESVVAAMKLADEKYWFQPGKDRGACISCDAGMYPGLEDCHDPACYIQMIHEALATGESIYFQLGDDEDIQDLLESRKDQETVPYFPEG